MSDEPLRSPLNWPAGKPRTSPLERKRAAFSREPGHAPTVERGRRQLELELGRMGVREFILSTNLALRLDGSPRSGQPAPDDPGAAVYFDFDGKATVLACDRWNRVEDNIRAIVKHIDALRGQERWGVGSLAQAFAGYQALPAPGQHARRPWRTVFGWRSDEQGITRKVVHAVYRMLAREYHPDNGGDPARWHELQRAKADALEELGS